MVSNCRDLSNFGKFFLIFNNYKLISRKFKMNYNLRTVSKFYSHDKVSEE